MRLYLVRHGESSWNSERRIQGHADVGLSALGHVQAERAAQALASTPFSAAFSSDLARAMETVRIIVGERPVAPVPVADLREQNLGPLQGMTWADAEQQIPEVARGWVEDGRRFRPPGGESFEDVVARADRFLAMLGRCVEHGHVLVVAHGGSIRAILYHLLGLDPYDGPWLRIDNAGITELEPFCSPVRLHRLNETAHLAGLPIEGPVF